MVFCCSNCCKEFKTNWQLQRHLRKKIPCKKHQGGGAENSSSGAENSSSGAENSSSGAENSLNCCTYCNKALKRNRNLLNHMSVCAAKDDAVRCLEIQLNIPYPKHTNNKMCRFCDYNSTSTSNVSRHMHSCKAKQIYKVKLEAQIQNKVRMHASTVNTNCYNNNIINNNTIVVNPLGQEDISYITCEVIKGILKEVTSDDEFMAKTLAHIHAHEDHPENHNILYSNLRSNAALVKYRDKFEYKNIDIVLKKVMSNWLDSLVFTENYERLPKGIKEKYESTCEDDEMNKATKSILKVDLYNNYKSGNALMIAEQ